MSTEEATFPQKRRAAWRFPEVFRSGVRMHTICADLDCWWCAVALCAGVFEVALVVIGGVAKSF